MLYSVPDDTGAVARARTSRAPRRRASWSVEPAFEALRRAHDRTVHGLRRYRRGGLAGWPPRPDSRCERATYAYSFLAPPAAALGLLDRDAAGAGAGEHRSDVDRRALDRVFAPLAAPERRWLAHRDLPVGSSVVVRRHADPT